MLTLPILWAIQGWTWLRNLWRRLLRRQSAYVRLDLRGALPEFGPPVAEPDGVAPGAPTGRG
jgi:hypothetical protein